MGADQADWVTKQGIINAPSQLLLLISSDIIFSINVKHTFIQEFAILCLIFTYILT